MAKDKTLELTIKIAGQMDRSLTSAISSAQRNVGNLSKNLSRIGTVGLAAIGALGVGTVKVLNDATKKAEEFEQQMSDVVKYVDGLADAQGKITNAMDVNTGRTYAENYERMKTAIIDLTAQIPYTREEMTKLAAVFGQSGVEFDKIVNYDANGKVQGYLKDAAMWATAMDVQDPGEVASWMSKWELAFKMTHEEVMEMADVINYLGANSATTAVELAQVYNSAGSLGEIAGVSGKTTIALADAMLAMNVPADQVSTSLKRIYQQISKGSNASKPMKEMWQELGFTAEGIAKAMQADGTGTMLKVFKAIQNLPSDRRVAAISTLFGQRSIEGAAKLANNMQPIFDALNMVNDPNAYNGSMMREFIIKADTTEALGMMSKSAIEGLQIEIGNAFLPVKKQFLTTIIDITDGLRKNGPELKEFAQSMANFLGTMLQKIGTSLTDALPKIRKVLDYLTEHGDTVLKFIGGLAAAFTGMKFAPLISGLANAGGGLFSAGKSGGGILANLFGKGRGAANSLSTLLKEGSGIQAMTGGKRGTGLLASLLNSKSILSGNKDKALTGAGNAMQAALNAKEGGYGILGMLKNAFTGSKVGQGISGALAGGKSWLSGIGAASGITGKLGAMFAPLTSALPGLAAGFGGIVTGALPLVGIFSTIVASGSLLYDNLDGIKGIIGNTFGEQGLVVFNAFKEKLDGIIGFIDKITHGGLADALSGIREGFVGLFDGKAAELAGQTFDGITQVAQGILNVVGQVVDFANTYVKPIIQNIFYFIVNNVLPTILNTFNAVAPAIQSVIESIGSVIMSVASVIGSAIQALLPVFEGIIDVIMHIAEAVLPFLGNVVSTVFGAISTVVSGIGQVFQGVFDVVGGIIQGLCSAFQGMADFIGGVFEGLVNLIKMPINAIISLVNGVIGAINNIGITIPDWVPGLGGKRLGFSIPQIPLLAKGGFTNGPSIAGEAGREAVISFDNAVRSQNIETWAKAGEMLGVNNRELKPFDTSGGGMAPVTFAPNITINGNADQDVVDNMVGQMQAMFENWYEQKQRLQGRTAY